MSDDEFDANEEAPDYDADEPSKPLPSSEKAVSLRPTDEAVPAGAMSGSMSPLREEGSDEEGEPEIEVFMIDEPRPPTSSGQRAKLEPGVSNAAGPRPTAAVGGARPSAAAGSTRASATKAPLPPPSLPPKMRTPRASRPKGTSAVPSAAESAAAFKEAQARLEVIPMVESSQRVLSLDDTWQRVMKPGRHDSARRRLTIGLLQPPRCDLVNLLSLRQPHSGRLLAISAAEKPAPLRDFSQVKKLS